MALKMDDQTVEWRMWKEYQPGKPGPTPGSTKTSHVSFLGLTTFLCKMKEEDFFFFSINIIVPSYHGRLHPKPPSGFLKPQRVPNPIRTIFFPIQIYL